MENEKLCSHRLREEKVPDKRIFFFKKCFGCGSACSFATTRNDYAGEQNKLVAVVAIACFVFTK